MKIEIRPLSEIFPYETNARKIPQSAVDKVAASLLEYGWQQPIVVDKKSVIVVGHVRRLAALQLGWTEAPVHVADKLTPAQIRAYRLMDNRSHLETAWDLDILKMEIDELKGLDFNLDLTGFDSRELDSLLRSPNEAADDAPSLPELATTRLDDLWLVGKHRLLCGNATDADAVERACAGRAIDAIWTDPPYGVNYVGKTQDALTIQGDAAEGVEALVRDALRAIEPHVISCAPFYIAHPAGPLYLAFGRAVYTAGWRISQGLVWVKDSMVLGHSDYHYSHEPILYGFAPGEGRPGRGKHRGTRWYGDHSQTTVFNIARPKRSSEHPTMKPVELIQRCLTNSLKRGGLLADPFCGSGSTLIAADLSERHFVGLDIDPRYCDVAVIRWQNLTGKKATLEGSGATFEHVREGRRLEAEDAIKEEILSGKS
jgi:site-specific DNA-methyltransferase (adenine-specific)